jgi:hypothetical protein
MSQVILNLYDHQSKKRRVEEIQSTTPFISEVSYDQTPPPFHSVRENQVKRVRRTKESVIASVTSTVAPSTTPIAWETEVSTPLSSLDPRTKALVEKLVLKQLVRNPLGFLDASLITVKGITPRHVKEVRDILMLFTEVPYRLHEIMFRFHSDCRFENGAMITAMKREIPLLLSPEYLRSVIPMWKRHCIDPLLEFMRPDSRNANVPCILNAAKRTMVLTEDALRGFFRELLASYQ